MEEEITSFNSKRCVACKQAIPFDASLCAHCATSQRFHQFRHISLGLKWLGGVLTIISFVIGMITLVQLYQDHDEKQQAIVEMSRAANWLIYNKNYQQAWQMLEKAEALNASSSLIRKNKFELALQWLREFYLPKELVNDQLNKITETLYIGLANADSHNSSTIMAHIGYVQVIKQHYRLPVLVDVNAIFERALMEDSSNVFANAMNAAWLLAKRPITEHKIEQSFSYFKQALNNEQYYDFTSNLMFTSLIGYSYGYSDEIEQRVLKGLLYHALENYRKGHDKPHSEIRRKLIDGYGRMARQEHVDYLVDNLPASEHKALYLWLILKDKTLTSPLEYQQEYIFARIAERQGNTQQALAQYQLLASYSLNSSLKAKVDKAIKRIVLRSSPSNIH